MKAIKGKFLPKGVHVPDNKQWSMDVPIEVMDAPDIVAISTQQHIGLLNVNHRLKLIYGMNEAGIQIERSDASGTRVLVRYGREYNRAAAHE